jgi:alpha-1,6-mannosyltransferase
MTAPAAVPDVFAPSAVSSPQLRAPLPPPDRFDARLAVLDVSEYYGADSGGVRTYLHAKAQYVAGHSELRQVIVVPDAGRSVQSDRGVRMYRVPGPRIPFQSTYRVLAGSSDLRRIIAHERPDLVEVGSAYGAPWMASRAAHQLDVPLVWYFHAHLPRIVAPGLRASPWPRRWAAGLAVRYVRAIAARVDLVLVASGSVQHDLAAFGIRNVRVAPLGVDTGTFQPERRARRADTLARHGLPDAPIVLFTGRFTREKELEPAVAAWSAVRTPGAVLVLVGAGPLAARLRAQGDGRVRVLPFEHDDAHLADLYSAADLYLAPGPAETFGLSAHEALACGTPVLSVDRGAVADAVARAGCGGTWVHGNGGDMAAQADALLAQGDAGRAAARDYIMRHHRWETVFDHLFGIYAELVAGAHR